MKYSVLLLLLMIVACSVPESDASSHYYTSYDSFNNTTWKTSDGKITVVFSGDTAQVTFDSKTYNLKYFEQKGNGTFVFKSGTGDEAGDGTGPLLILGSSTRTRFSYQFYTGAGNDRKQEQKQESGDLILSTKS